MAWETIHKHGPGTSLTVGAWPRGVEPNVTDYEAERREFSWAAARERLDGLPGGRGLNIAHEAVDRHADGPALLGRADGLRRERR